MLRSVLAVIGPIVAVMFASVVTEQVLMTALSGHFSSDGRTADALALALTVAYSALYSFGGGYAVASIAGRAESRHAIGCALVVLLLSAAAFLAGGRPVPVWFVLVSLVLPTVAILAGGTLATRRKHARRATGPVAAPFLAR